MLLGVSKRIADKDACQMEHILSVETMDRIRDFLRKAKESKEAAEEQS